MIAIIGLPGSMQHSWESFHIAQHGGSVKAAQVAAGAWLDAADLTLQEEHPAAHPQPLEVLSNRDAAKVRWIDGSRVYVYPYE